MYYCENCHCCTDVPICPTCGRKNLREVSDKDFCFLSEKSEMWAKLFEQVLNGHDIPCVLIPAYGFGLTAKTGKPENCQIYVPYRLLQTAEKLLTETFG